MSEIGERAARHFAALSHRTIEVPEWGEAVDAPLIIYAKPVSTMDAMRIYKAGRESSFEMFVEALLLLAQDANGKAIFDIGDKPHLRRSSREVVERVGEQLLKSRDGSELMEPFENVIKN